MDRTSDSMAVLHLQGVKKVFRMWSTPSSRLWVPMLQRLQALLPVAWAERIEPLIRQNLRAKTALEGINLSLMRGEALGVIGLNGAGKSTLLQIIAGVLEPSEGRVTVHGRIAALLELGSGFNPEMTGIENARINAAILGLSEADIDARLPEIVAFADIGEYIDQPVKTYSSGMVARLAFAVQAHIDPDILIVDEALAVGDAAFQLKAMARIGEVLAQGATLLFVGHDLNAVRVFCQRAILLESGKIIAEGEPEEVIERYLFLVHRDAASRDGRSARRDARGFSSEEAAVREVVWTEGVDHLAVVHGHPLSVRASIRLEAGYEGAVCVFDVLDSRGLPISGRRIPIPGSEFEERLLHVDFNAAFSRGAYRIRLRIVRLEHSEHVAVLARHEAAISFEVVDDCRDRFTGLMPLPFTWRVESSAAR